MGTAHGVEAGEAAGLRHRMGHWRYKLNHLANASIVCSKGCVLTCPICRTKQVGHTAQTVDCEVRHTPASASW